MSGTDKGHTIGLIGASLALAWLLGVALHLTQAALPAPAVHAALLAVGALGLWVARWRGVWWLGLPACVALALAWAGLLAQARLEQRLDADLQGQDLQLIGMIDSLPQRMADGWRFQFAVESASLQGRAVRVPDLLSLGWYGGDAIEPELLAARGGLHAGQRWRWTVRLKQVHGSVNPFGFDAELWLFEQGIRATGTVRDTAAQRAQLLTEQAGAPVQRARQMVRDAIDANVADARVAGVLAALTVGDQASIDHERWDLFRATGVAHLMSISGLHITMFAWLAARVLRMLWRRSERLMLWLPAVVAARWGGVAASAAYALFSGWGVPSQRTVLMLAWVAWLAQRGVRWPWPLILLTAAVAVTVFDPWALLQAGFWLSFVAVAVLMASSPVSGIEVPAAAATWPGRVWRAVRADLRTQVVATVGLTPLSMVFFQQVSVVGFAANVVAIPLVTLLITPLALLGVLWAPLWSLAAVAVEALTAYLSALQAVPWAVWSAAAAPPWAQMAGLLGGLLCVLPLPWRLRTLSVPLLLPLLWPTVVRPPVGQFELIAADIGQGTAVLVHTHAHTLLFDAGPSYGRDSDAGQRVLLPLLRALGEERVHRLLLSHRDVDHVGGAAAVLRGVPVDVMSSSLEDGNPLLELAAQRQVSVQRCVDGQTWDWDGVRFTMLRPEAQDYARGLKSNAMSCVLRVHDAAKSALLTGDIEAEQERALRQRYGAALRSDVLIVPHHGSSTSSTADFIDTVQPRIAVFQAGYRNRFKHPAPDVVQRYEQRGIVVVRSDRCGAWKWAVDDGPQCERELGRRYWSWSSDDR